MQWKNIRFTQTEANLIPADDKVNIDYNNFLDKFGEEGNLIVLASKDPKIIYSKSLQSVERNMMTNYRETQRSRFSYFC